MPSGVQIAQAFARFQASKRPSFDATTFIGALQQRDPAAARAIETLQDAVNQLSRDLYSLQLEIFPQLIVLGRNGAPISWIGDNPPYRGGWFQELYIGGANPSVSKIIADQNGNVTIDGSVLIFGTVTAAAFNILIPVFDGLSFQNNTPGAGQITWPSCNGYYAATGYSISGGNTSLPFLYWDAGNSTFTPAASFAPQTDRFLIATNVNGVASIAWNNALPNKGIQEANLSFTLPGGYHPQAIGTATITHDATKTVTLINESVRGYLLFVGMETASALTAGTDVFLDIYVDGQPVQSIQIMDDANTDWFTDTRVIAHRAAGAGGSAGDVMVLSFGIPYDISIKVDIRLVRVSGGAGDIRYVLWRAKKVT